MSVSSSHPGDDENEIHDLVLLFANSRMPRGSDAFQAILDDFLPSDDNDSADSRSNGSRRSSRDVDENKLDQPVGATKTARTISPKPLAHVHWPDEKNRKLTSSPAIEKRHHARLYVKTTPVKPILKHDEDVFVDADRQTASGNT